MNFTVHNLIILALAIPFRQKVLRIVCLLYQSDIKIVGTKMEQMYLFATFLK
jgi:hypothetical protein